MTRCFELARKALGDTYPNPLVGAVITYNGKIIGEGYHKKAGTPHAEINAINQVQDPSVFNESTIYVSLEPCSHYGRTPPCALKLKELGFKRVVIGVLDPSEKVHNKGVALLEDAGIEVTVGVLEAQARDLNKRFFTSQIKKRPYIILKWAQSADGYLDRDFNPAQISNPLMSQWVHHLRHQEHAIFVGTQTALRDNPSLTVRNLEGTHPTRLVLDLELKIPLTHTLYDQQVPTLIFNAVKSEHTNGVEYIKVDPKELIPELLKNLNSRAIQSVLVEGGARMHQQFIDLGLWDAAYRITNPSLKLKSGTRAPELEARAHQQFEIEKNTLDCYLNP